MARLPPIPDPPADRPETWPEYLGRRAMVAMHRQFADDLAVWLTREPPFDPFDYFGRVNAPVLPRSRGLPIPVAYGSGRAAANILFTGAGVLQVTNLDIDLAPELKELLPPAEAKWIDEEIERLGVICDGADPGWPFPRPRPYRADDGALENAVRDGGQ